MKVFLNNKSKLKIKYLKNIEIYFFKNYFKFKSGLKREKERMKY